MNNFVLSAMMAMMDSILSIVQQLDFEGEPGLTQLGISTLERAVGHEMPELLRQHYRYQGGMQQRCGFPMRLLTPAEVVGMAEATRAWSHPSAVHQLALFWTDDNSNYAGLYVEGPLVGKICFLDHGEPDICPVYRTVESFYERLIAAHTNEESWYDMPRDYPSSEATLSESEATSDELLGRFYLDQAVRADCEEESQFAALTAMNLLPTRSADQIIPLLGSDDMWIQERACEILGRHKYEPAVDALVRVAESGMHNGKSAAISALRRIGSTIAKRQVQRLKSVLGADYEFAFRDRRIPDSH